MNKIHIVLFFAFNISEHKHIYLYTKNHINFCTCLTNLQLTRIHPFNIIITNNCAAGIIPLLPATLATGFRKSLYTYTTESVLYVRKFIKLMQQNFCGKGEKTYFCALTKSAWMWYFYATIPHILVACVWCLCVCV